MTDNPRSSSGRGWLSVAALALALGLALGWAAWPRLEAAPYASFVRPDHKYRVLVRRKRVLAGLMPGQGGDAPGRAELWDAHGRLLHSADVEMVQLVEHVEWAQRSAHIKLIADWELPE